MIISEPLCFLCSRNTGCFYDELNDETFYFCEAYPDGIGIPKAVQQSGHFNPKPGDHNLQFTPRSGVDEETIAKYKNLYKYEEENYRYYSQFTISDWDKFRE